MNRFALVSLVALSTGCYSAVVEQNRTGASSGTLATSTATSTSGHSSSVSGGISSSTSGGTFTDTGVSSTASSTTSGSSSTSGSSGTTGGCGPNGSPYEYAQCNTSADCACPSTCLQGMGGSACIRSCQVSSDCQDVFDTCQGGSCLPTYCFSTGGLCNLRGQNDGTCVSFSYQGQSFAYCILNGAEIFTCDPTVFNTYQIPQSPNTLCASGEVCAQNGECGNPCSPASANTCVGGQTCQTQSVFGLSYGVCLPGTGTSGTASSSTSGATGTGTGGFSPAPHQPFVQVDYNQGPVVAHPKIVTLSYPGYEQQYPLSAYTDWIAQSKWLAQVGADYGVGNGVHAADVVFQNPPPGVTIDDSAIGPLLVGVALDAGLRFDGGALLGDPSVIYMIYYPAGFTITLQGSKSCQSFGGYHSTWPMPDAGSLNYAVIPNCTQVGAPPSTLWVAGSHELIEACTDPSYNQPAYLITNPGEPQAWDYSEVGDLCAGTSLTEDGGFIAQRVYSNVLAADGGSSPCIPVPAGDLYYNVSPVGPQGNGLVYLPRGAQSQTVTFTVTGWSDQPVAGGWTVLAYQTGGSITPTSYGFPGGAPQAAFNNGTVSTFSLTIPGNIPRTDAGPDFATFELLSSQDPTFQIYNAWPVSVVLQ